MTTAVSKRVEPGPSAAARPASDPYYMESLARGLSVIRVFGPDRPRLTGAEVAALTGLSRAAARRCLHTLSVLGYAQQSRGGYELTPAVLTLGHAYPGSHSLTRAVQPILERVQTQLQESCAVAVLDGEDIVFVARAAARRILSVEITVGGRLPAAVTASGRVILAWADEAQRARYLTRARLLRHTPHSIVDKKALRAELERVRTQGYAIVDQELELGLRSIAVPIRRRDGVVQAALNLGVQAARVDTRALREFFPVLRAAAADIGAGF